MVMEKGADDFDRWIKFTLSTLTPQRRKILFKKLAILIRRNQQKNITAQQNPDGSKWEARKAKNIKRAGQIKSRQKMMMGLRQARRMKITPGPEGFKMGFTGRNAQIATIHQTGGMDTASSDGPEIRYPIRQLLGFSKQDTKNIQTALLDHLAGAFK